MIQKYVLDGRYEVATPVLKIYDYLRGNRRVERTSDGKELVEYVICRGTAALDIASLENRQYQRMISLRTRRSNYFFTKRWMLASLDDDKKV
mmetsp:Transcript_3249/g.4681  ORF Transcript_3249/g.4681 Transcript_3249/m.4681 type:complete len:92 (+) Transcript_3249:3956-4231(+)